MNILIQGKPIQLNASDLIASAGEGSVFRYGQKAIKIYHQPTPEHENKLTALLNNPPKTPFDNLILPLELCRDPKGKVVGFVMPLIGTGFEDLRSLSNRKYRTAFRVTARQIAQLFMHAGEAVQAIHKSGYCIGDFSDLNEKFTGSTMLFLDVDSWQFDQFPCAVATEQFLAPELYGIDLGRKPVFKPEHDWYAFGVLLFKSLLGVHPYGGTHRDYKTLVSMASHKKTVFDSDVKYPTIGQSPDLLSSDLHDYFEQMFKVGKRSFDSAVLDNYFNSLVDCPNCGATYPIEQKACPVCSARQIVIPAQLTVSGVVIKELFKTQGPIIFSKVIEGTLHLVVIAEDRTVHYIYLVNPAQAVIGSYKPGTRYEYGQGIKATNEKGSNEIVLTIEYQDYIHSQKLETGQFAGRAMFRVSNCYLFRIAAGQLMAGFKHQLNYIERPIRPVMTDQTWFAVKQNDLPDHPVVCGFFQVFHEQKWWLYWHNRLYDNLPLTPLAADEVQIDVLVRFDDHACLIERSTQMAGVDFRHVAIVDEKGHIQHQESHKESRTLPHGSLYNGQQLLQATDEGLIREHLPSGTIKTFDGTKGVVEEGDTLHAWGKGLLIVKENRVVQLTL